MTRPGRAADVLTVVPDDVTLDPTALTERLSRLSVRGLTQMYEPRSRSFPHSVRAGGGEAPPAPHGLNVRYTAIAALGLSRMDAPTRRRVLADEDLADLLPGILGLALAGRDPGALALAVWAAGEIAGIVPDAVLAQSDRLSRALDRLVTTVPASGPFPTVEHAWTTIALLQATSTPQFDVPRSVLSSLEEATRRAVSRLRDAQGTSGLFPHHVPPDTLSRFRYHVSCFADQAYAVQALARYAAATGDAEALASAGRCADRLVALQGERGQWWWHYDWRYGRVVEAYPVYSVQQYAIAPMALLELWEAGGPDHREAVARGLTWLLRHPEARGELILDDAGVVWRTVSRREPRKLVRKMRSAASAARPGRRLGWLDALFPPGRIDQECRPFELGWILYAWHAAAPVALVRAESDSAGLHFSGAPETAGECA
jgi:hypothetical protein